MIEGRAFAAGVSLGGYEAFIVGGKDGNTALASTEEDSFGFNASGPPMQEARAFPIAAQLADGDILVAGGHNGTLGTFGSGSYLSSAEVFSFSTGAWTTVASMHVAREGAASAVLPEGDVLVAGGEDEAHTYLSSVEVYDPEADTWTEVAPMRQPREREVAAQLPDGDILVAGGENASGPLNTSEIYDPESNVWTAAAPMLEGREGAAAVTLSNGEVFVVGGEGASGAVTESTEVYDPRTNSWRASVPMLVAREGPVAVMVTGGHVLVAGGEGGPRTIEMFSLAPLASVAGGDFGDETVGERSAVSQLIVTSLGSNTLSLTGALLSGVNAADFEVTEDACTTRRLAFAESCTISVRFTPSGEGPEKATLKLVDNEARPDEVALTGEGVAANAGPEGPPGQQGNEGPQGQQGNEGPQGQQGPQGAAGVAGSEGHAGATGAAGPEGPAGKTGATGAAGATGAQGPAGPTGPAGPRGPAGKVELITCERSKPSGAQECKTKRGSVPVKFSGVGGKLAAVLARNGRIYGKGFELSERHGVTQLLLRPRRRIAKGSYSLTLKRGGHLLHETIELG